MSSLYSGVDIMPIICLMAEIAAAKWEVGYEKTDKRQTYIYIGSELKIVETIYPHTVLLEERPYRQTGVSISGYTEVLAMPTTDNTFYVDYEDSTLYFYSNQAGEPVRIQYYGMGSVVAANDMNRFAEFLCSMKPFLTAFFIEPSDPIDTNVNLIGGYINKGTSLAYISDKILKFGTGQEYEVSAISALYWKKLLVSVNISTEAIIVTEGAESSSQETAALPAIPANCKPCSIVSVQDDGSAAAGTIQDISSIYIEDVRAITNS